MISQKLQNKIVELAQASAELPNSSKKHFSFICNKNRIISFGWNNGFKSHPLSARYGHRFNGIHSELAAIRNFPYQIGTLGLYRFINVRILASGQVGMAKPCGYCQHLLHDFGVSHVYYSNDRGEMSQL
jgi:tRNA(Arg) A34 adenosine deaminase TadA